MGEGKSTGLFSIRRKIARWKRLSGAIHLCTVFGLVAGVLWLMPQWGGKIVADRGQEVRELESQRQLLMEAMDKLARYQKHYAEIHGRFTRDIDRLSLPDLLASGSLQDLKRTYELSVLEVHPGRFLLLATGLRNSDRMTIDESHRTNANFILPTPSRAYLEEEADRILRLRALGVEVGDGLFARYWRMTRDESRDWIALGQRKPVLGERRMVAQADASSSLFVAVKERVQSRLGQASDEPGREIAAVKALPTQEGDLSGRDVNEWLGAAHLAQHIHFRERGRFARRWEELDTVSDFGFAQRMRRAKNVRVKPIEFQGPGEYRLVIEGTSGDLLGEQFVLDRSGAIRQVRYTEALIPQLQETTDFLENFQINPLVDDSPQDMHP